MALPTVYTREFNFSNFQASSPDDPLPASHVDAEFNRIKQVLDETRAYVASLGVQVYDSATTTQLNSAADPVNGDGKVAGRAIRNSTTNKLVMATGSATTSTWVNTGTGIVEHTPA